MTALEAVAALPFRCVSWRETIDGEGNVDMRVTCERPDLTQVRVREIVTREDLRLTEAEAERLLGLHRSRIVEEFRHSHPEVLPRGAQ